MRGVRNVGYNSPHLSSSHDQGRQLLSDFTSQGENADVDRIDAVQATASISISGEPDPLGVEVTRMRSIPMAIHAALQTTA